MKTNKQSKQIKQIWMVIECAVPNIVGFLIDSSLGFGLSICWLLWHLIMEDKNMNKEDEEKTNQSAVNFMDK